MEPAAWCQLVQAHCKRTRQLRQAEAQLCWDLLLVTRAGRPACMLDYAAVPAAPLKELLLALHEATGVQCTLLSWGSSCHLVCNLVRLLARLRDATAGAASEDACPLMLHFSAVRWAAGEQPQTGASTTPCFLTREQAQGVLRSLQPLLTAIEQQLEQEQHRRVVCVDLERVPGLPLMPTLNGWLLGYPLIYVVQSVQEAQQAARYLSLHDVTVFQAKAAAVVVQGQRQGGGKAAALEGPLFKAGAVLSSFSVPTHLLMGPEGAQACADVTDAARPGFPLGRQQDGEAAPSEQECSCPSSSVLTPEAEPGGREACRDGLTRQVEAWLAAMRQALHGEGWAAEVTCCKEDRGLQNISL